MNRNSNDMADSTCVVCCRDSVRIFAIGECDHPVCYECATRMRVLGGKNECAICRSPLPKVIFVKHRNSYSGIADLAYPLWDRKYQLYFEDEDVQYTYYRLLEHRCQLCKTRPSYTTLGQLKDHMRREHERQYCDLCVENLTVFTHERKCYNRADLARHRRIGDVDDTSHRGHPRCDFCDKRYVDIDELFRHLRRDHFYCHFCDADGLHHYYSDYEYLREHFRVEHFQCNDEACREERFTTAFRTEIDLKAHRTAVHNRNMTKAQAKQARTLELQFTITPRVPSNSAPPTSGTTNETYVHDGDVAIQHRKGRRGDHGSQKDGPSSSNAFSSSRSNTCGRDPHYVTFTSPQDYVARLLPTPDIDLNLGQFPMLGERSVTTTSNSISNAQDEPGNSRNHTVDTLARKLVKSNRFTVGRNDGSLGDTEFPALCSSYGPSSMPVAARPPTTSWMSSGNVLVKASSNHVTPTASSTVNKKLLTVKLNSNDDFPGLAATKKVAKPSVSLQVSRTVIPQCQNGSSTAVIKRQLPVVTRMTTSQNITFLDNPTQTTTKDRPKESKDQLGKSGDGWVVFKKGEKKSGSTAAQRRATGSSDIGVKVNHEEDFPALETKKTKDSITMVASIKSKEKKLLSVVNVAQAFELQTKNRQEPSRHIANNVENGRKTQLENEEIEVLDLDIASTSVTTDTGFNGMSVEDFPDLNSKNLKTQRTSSSAAARLPPPGFGKLKARQTGPPPGFFPQAVKPPPGFTPAIAPSDPPSAVTFTNSNGQKYTFSTTKVKSHEYLQPDGFQTRNQKLMERLADTLKNKDKFATFRLLSGFYCKGEIAAADYYKECCDVLGQDEFSRIFPELLVLLPDIQKQQMLLVFHKASQKQLQDNNKNNALSAKHAHELTTTATAGSQQILVCATCQQVLSMKDFRTHMDHHSLDEDFPSLLGSGRSSSIVQSQKATWVGKNKNI